MSTIISAQGLTKSYGKHRALDGVSFEIKPGRIVGLIGPNGAGKTTAMKAILGLTSFGGSLSVLGFDPRKERGKLMQNVSFVADVAVLPKWIRVRELMAFVEGVHPRFDPAKALKFLATTKISLEHKVRELSKGMVVQMHLALIMAIDARLLVLDEPTLGLDILFRKEFYTTLLNDYLDEQRTILVTTHQVEEIEHILTDLLFIEEGKIVLDSSMDEVQERYTELMVTPENADQARALNPLSERHLFGKSIFLFDGADPLQLAELGELHTPSVADLFVATIKGHRQ